MVAPTSSHPLNLYAYSVFWSSALFGMMSFRNHGWNPDLSYQQEASSEAVSVKDIRFPWMQIALRLRRFLLEFYDFSAFFCIHDTKTACFFHRNLNNGDGCICMMFFVVIKHLIVVHLADMVTRKNQQIFRCIGINKVNVLRNSIRSSSVYVQVCICFFPWWQNIYAAVFGIQTPSSSCGCITVQQDGFV